MERETPGIAVLLSGAGRTLANLLDRIGDGRLSAHVPLVLSDREGVGGLEIARRAGIAAEVVSPRTAGSPEAFSAAVFDRVRASGARLVALAGFLRLLPVPKEFENRVVNIHPALIPAFSGRGFYGHRVHQAVLDHGCKVTGCTVHFVDNQYDAGPIIAQRAVPVADDDTADTLAARVFAAECELYPQVLADVLAGRVVVENRRARVFASG